MKTYYNESDIVKNNCWASKYLTIRRGMVSKDVLCRTFNFSVNAILVFKEDEEELDEFLEGYVLDKMISCDQIDVGYLLSGTLKILENKLILDLK